MARTLQSHCKHGHEFDEANTAIDPDGSRRCRACCRATAQRHYQPRVRRTAVERFWGKADTSAGPDACWLWRASRERGGYGMFHLDGKKRLAHRVAYELAIGPVPEGLVLDHLCRTRDCVNPKHLEPVTFRENVLRGAGITAQCARKSHCLRGHPLSGPNLYLHSDGRRECRSCRPTTLAGRRAGRG
jgi:hypothetical protein